MMGPRLELWTAPTACCCSSVDAGPGAEVDVDSVWSAFDGGTTATGRFLIDRFNGSLNSIIAIKQRWEGECRTKRGCVEVGYVHLLQVFFFFFVIKSTVHFGLPADHPQGVLSTVESRMYFATHYFRELLLTHFAPSFMGVEGMMDEATSREPPHQRDEEE